MLSLTHQFLAWCRSKPADEEYDYQDIHRCACGQFGNELGLLKEGASFAASNTIYSLHRRVKPSVSARPWTFGALAERVERQLVEQVRQ